MDSSPSTKLIFVVRHALPDAEYGYTIGDKGKRQADQCGQTLTQKLIQYQPAIMTSPIERCLDTAAIIAEYFPDSPLTSRSWLANSASLFDLLEQVCDGVESLPAEYNATILVTHEPIIRTLCAIDEQETVRNAYPYECDFAKLKARLEELLSACDQTSAV